MLTTYYLAQLAMNTTIMKMVLPARFELASVRLKVCDNTFILRKQILYIWRSHRDSNAEQRVRSPPVYPLAYRNRLLG